MRPGFSIKRVANQLCYTSLLCFCVYSTSVVGADVLPTPLTLSQALSYADSAHPDLQLADANLAYALSQRQATESTNDIDAYFEIAPYTSNPTTNDRFVDDSYLRLSVTKTLYDFGYSNSLEASGDESVLSQELLASDTRNKNYLKIMRSYFDVLLADLNFSAVDEEMTSIYVKYDKLKERQLLGIISEVEAAEAESLYRDAADRRKLSELEQQASRQRLAIVLNRPDELPAELLRPQLPELDKAIPEIDSLLDDALSNNLMLTALEHAMLADKASLKATKNQFGPTLAAGLELNEYSRDFPSRNTASIGLNLRIPILNGSRSQAESARATAQLSSSQAKYDQAKYALRQQLSDLLRRLQLLQFKRATDKLRLNSTALTMDKNRARYEMELQTTLGNSMANYTQAEWMAAINDFDMAITWAQIDVISGKKLYQATEN